MGNTPGAHALWQGETMYGISQRHLPAADKGITTAPLFLFLHEADKNRPLFEAWNQEDPVDPWGCERHRRIAALQGNSNPFVAAALGHGDARG